jgi:siderophore synthetase component
LALRAGPLAAAFEGYAIAGPSIEDHLGELWRAAVRETSWRLLASAARERLVPAERSDDTLRSTIAGQQLEIPLARRGAFELDTPALAQLGSSGARLDDPLALLAAIADAEQLGELDRARLELELCDSIRNLAQARLAGALWDLAASRPRFADDPRLHDPEHFVIDGHPWHVMARTRLGLRPAEVVRHAPEQLATTATRCVEVDAGIAQVAGDYLDEAERWFGRASPGFVRIPVHPAQRRRLARLFPDQVAAGQIRHADVAPVPGRSLLSLRTVAIADDRHLKLACDVHTTSTRRWVSPMSVHNGPELTRTLLAIQARDPICAGLQLWTEPAAAGLAPGFASDFASDFASNFASGRVGDQAGQLGAIFRVVPRPSGDERAWVCAAIGERWPGTTETVVERAAAGYPGGRAERLDALLDAWITQLIPPALRLFVGYGIALELHLQNTLVRVADGRVIGFCVRDLGGVRIHGPRLAAAGLATSPSFAPGSFIVTDDLAEVRGKLEHTLVHAHLAHLVAVVARFGLDEDLAWARVRACVQTTLSGWAGDPELAPSLRDRAQTELAELTRPRVRAKALLRMRLRERSSEYDYTEVANVLAPRAPR